MGLYFFHIRNHVDTDDEEGVELPDLAAVRERALENARVMVCENVKQGHLNLDHRIFVTDDSGEEVVTVTFRDAFTLEG